MNWFKNLNAMPRPMSSFGVLLVLTLVISYLAITNLSKANDRISTLFQDDMAGSRQANQIAKDRLALGREARDAMLHIQDSAAVAADERSMLAYFQEIHSTLDEMKKTFYSKEGQEATGIMRDALPAWETGYHDWYDRIKAKDLPGSMAQMDTVTKLGKTFFDASARAIEVKLKRADEKFEENTAEYHTARTLMLSAVGFSLLLGIALSIFIARGFSVPLGQAVVALEKVAGGDLTVSLDVDTKDEM